MESLGREQREYHSAALSPNHRYVAPRGHSFVSLRTGCDRSEGKGRPRSPWTTLAIFITDHSLSRGTCRRMSLLSWQVKKLKDIFRILRVPRAWQLSRRTNGRVRPPFVGTLWQRLKAGSVGQADRGFGDPRSFCGVTTVTREPSRCSWPEGFYTGHGRSAPRLVIFKELWASSIYGRSLSFRP
jgi:hypothetical protein